MKPKKLITIGLVLILVGAIILIVVNLIYGRQVIAYTKAAQDWSQNWTQNHITSYPKPESYGLTGTILTITYILASIGNFLIIIGIAYLIIFGIAMMAKRYGYLKESK